MAPGQPFHGSNYGSAGNNNHGAHLPMLRRTTAPAPSCCGRARNFLTTCLGFSIAWPRSSPPKSKIFFPLPTRATPSIYDDGSLLPGSRYIGSSSGAGGCVRTRPDSRKRPSPFPSSPVCGESPSSFLDFFFPLEQKYTLAQSPRRRAHRSKSLVLDSSLLPSARHADATRTHALPMRTCAL